MNTLAFTLCIGVGATLLTDVWGYARKPLFGIAPPDYALVGRWLAHMRHGRFRHAAISRAEAMPGEAALGWIAHYATGVAFAALLLVIGGVAWMEQPTFELAIAVGLGTVAAPFLLMQPGMGAGIAASRAANPTAARIQSLLMHGVFGIGLYVAGRIVNLLYV
jgi:hypothetical protein